jgi:hypothetical protein
VLEQLNEAIPIRVRYWPEHNGVNDAEHRCVGTNSDGERQHYSRCDNGNLSPDSKRLSNVLHEHGRPQWSGATSTSVPPIAHTNQGIRARKRSLVESTDRFRDNTVRL